MVIDKTGIEKILRKTQEDLDLHANEDSIYITTRYHDFEPSQQIGNDSIDLRINDTGYVLSSDYEYINTLSNEDFSKYFSEVSLDMKSGYTLMPGEILFIDTLERIHLKGNLIGRITGRSVFSRFGISVHCTQDKFSSGINSIVALQIINNSKVPLKIFPYQKLAQLVIEKTENNTNPYSKGTFSLEETYTLPTIKESDRSQYDNRTKDNILKLKPKRKMSSKLKSKSMKKILYAQAVMGIILTACISFACSLLNAKIVTMFVLVYIATDLFLLWLANDYE